MSEEIRHFTNVRHDPIGHGVFDGSAEVVAIGHGLANDAGGAGGRHIDLGIADE